MRTCSSSDTDGLRRQASDFVQTDLYSKYLQGAVFVGVLAAVDAGYSGDWSRIGAISRETEDWLKQVLPLLGTFHALSATVSGVAAGRAGRPWLWPVAKVSLIRHTDALDARVFAATPGQFLTVLACVVCRAALWAAWPCSSNSCGWTEWTKRDLNLVAILGNVQSSVRSLVRH